MIKHNMFFLEKLFYRTSLVAILSFLILCINPLIAQWLPDQRLTNAPGVSTVTINSLRCIAVNGDTVHVVWRDYRDGTWEIYYKQSQDGGIHWGSDVRLTNNSNVKWQQSIAVSGQNVHVVWAELLFDNWEVFYKRSPNGGISWTPNIQLTNNPAGEGGPVISVSGENLHLIFTSNRDGNGEVYYKRSIDNGITWSADTRLTNNPANSINQSIAVMDSCVHIVWQDFRDGNWEIYYKRSIDNGITWSADTRLTINTDSSNTPSIAVSDSNVHVVWFDNRTGNYEIFYKRSPNNGNSWSPDIQLTTSSLSVTPNIAVSDLNLHLVFCSNRDGNYEIYYKESSDGGSVWTDDIRLTNDLAYSGGPFVAAAESSVHVVWEDTRNGGDLEIYYKRSSPQYTLTIMTVGSGSVTKQPDFPTYTYGTWVKLTAVENPGWTFNNWSGDLTGANNPDSIFIDGDKAVTATFIIDTFTIISSVTGNGIIDPLGTTYITYGSNQSYTIEPNAGNHIDSVVVDGISQGVITNYTFYDISADHTITVYFSINTYTITASATVGGTITPSGEITVNYGDDTTFIIAPNLYYQIDSVLVDGITVGVITQYTFNDISYDHTIHAIFSSPPPGWTQKESIPHAQDLKDGKYVKDGAAMTAAISITDGDAIYAFHGNKSWQFYKYTPGVTDIWTTLESIPYGVKPTDSLKINKKKIGKGAALCYDGINTIYATKGNGTREFWTHDVAYDTWIAQPFVPVTKGLKGGTSIVYKEGKVYLLAGSQKSGEHNFYVYDVATNTWTASGDLELGPNNKLWKDGSCLTIVDNTIYALKGGDKYNPMYAFSGTSWITVDSIPVIDNLYGRSKKLIVKDGGAMCAGNGAIYAIKGGGANVFWKYTTTEGWIQSESIPRLHKKSVPKTGASLAYANGMVYLSKGNNTLEFWCYAPSSMSNVKVQMSKPYLISGVMAEPTNIYPFMLYQNSPNPFNSLTAMCYSIPRECNVTLSIYDITGKLVKILVNELKNSGVYSVNWNGTDDRGRKVGQGVYFYTLETSIQTFTKKLVLMK